MAAAEPTSHAPDWRTGLVVGLFAFAMIFGAALLEARLLVPNAHSGLDWLRLAVAGLLLGLVPAALLTPVCGWLRRREIGATAERLFFWLPTMLAFAASLVIGAANGRLELDALNIALIAGPLALFYLQRMVPGLARGLAYWLVPVGLSWLGLALLMTLLMSDIHGRVPELARMFPVLIGVASPVLFFVNAAVARLWQKRRSPRALLVGLILLGVGMAAGLAAVGWLQTWFVGIYLPLKAWFAISVTVGLWLVFEPLLGDVASRAPRLGWAVLAGALAVSGGCVWLATLPVPQRFGAFPAKSLVGLAAQALSSADDADGDGFYADSAGGNDCDDADAAVTPASSDPKANCWARRTAAPPDEPAPKARPASSAEHVVLVIIDATRADALYGDEASRRFPNLHRFAQRSVRFERAYSPGNSTMQSIVPMLAGVSPVNMLTSLESQRPLPPDKLLAARSVFRLGGDDVCTAMLAYTHGMEDWIINYSDDDFDVSLNETAHSPTGHSAPLAVEGVEKVLDTCAGRRLMLVLYIDDPHRDDLQGGYRCADGSIADTRECYFEEIGQVDRAFGRIEALLDQHDILDDAFVAVTADHGEAFGEHGHTEHSSSVFEEQVHVPLLVRLPGVEPTRIQTPVSLLGFKATAAGAAGFALHEEPLYPSWLPLVDADAPENTLAAPAYPFPITENWLGAFKRVWTSPSSAMIVGDEKLIYDWKTGYLRLYDLADDPAETHNLADARPERAQQLLDAFRAHEARNLTHVAR